MKQKMVIRVSMNGQKSRSKALQIAVGFSGVESAELKGDDKSQIEVTGDGVDAVKLTNSLRKKVGYAELIIVSAAAAGDGNKNESKESENEAEVQQLFWPNYHVGVLHYDVCVVTEYDPYYCSIM